MAASPKPKKSKTKADRRDVFVPVPDSDLDREKFQRNLAVFKNWMPHYGARLETMGQTFSRLVVNGDGEYDVEFRGERLYGMGGTTWAKKRMRNFHRKAGSNRLLLAAPDTRMLDDESNITVYNLMKRAVEADIAFLTEPQEVDCFHLIVLGIGLGDHLPALAKRTAAQNLLLVEPNMEFLYLSLFVFDWAGFVKGILAEDRHLSFVTDTDARQIAESVRDQMRYVHPSFMEGATFFTTYNNSITARALDLIIAERDTLSVGLGFLEDEIDMIRNSFHNLKNFRGKYFRRQDSVLPLPAFIIGSGPSLDNDLDFIRENQDKAIIISCGTSMRILLHNGITPDFHVELENVPIVADLMAALDEKFDLSPVTLIATSTVDPGVSKYFGNTVYYFRSGLASYPMFAQGRDSGLEYATPMVTNLGFSFAQEIGCRTSYNFGVDLGARDPEVHHAKDAPYDAGEADFDTTIDEPVPGNLGGTVYSEMVYLWAKQTMEMAAKRLSAKSIYYNCSDGVRLEGLVPRLSSTIELQSNADKKEVIRRLLDHFPQYTEDHFRASWYDYDPRERMNELSERIIRICRTGKRPPDPKAPARPKRPHTRAARYPLRYMMHVVRELIPPGPESTAEMHIMRGSTFLCMAAIIYYYMRVPKGPKRTAFLNIVREEFIEQVNRINRQIQDFYDVLDPPAETGEAD